MSLTFFSLDKEVLGYYDDGMRVPDDITLLWSDDKRVIQLYILSHTYNKYSWGNMVRLPIPSEFNRTGGAGVYYHVRTILLSLGDYPHPFSVTSMTM